MNAPDQPVLTLEPLIDAVREGVERCGWTLSGLQKTTSHEFAGRWQGESTRSAYLFFHRSDEGDRASVEAFLDETPRGIEGNLSLVLEGPRLEHAGDPRDVLGALATVARRRMPRAHPSPLSLRLRLADAGQTPDAATLELRVKLNIPRAAVRAGGAAVSELAVTAVRAFERLLEDPELRRFGGAA